MDENKDLSRMGEETDKEAEQSAAPEQTLSAPEEPMTEPAAAEPAPEEPTAEPAAEAPAEAPAASAPPAPKWDFGGDPAPKSGGKGAFFAIFGGVIALCVGLLVATLFLGGDGFRIVKTLHTERTVYVREDDGTSGLLTPNEAADVVRRSTVTVSVQTAAGKAIGSGFVYDENGHICTNYHVVEEAERIQVVLPDGRAVSAEITGYDAVADLAVLHVAAEGLVPAALGSSADLLVGDAVVAVGTPVDLGFAGTATFGHVSATERLLALTDSGGTVYRKITVIQTDASVNPGNSGGPMADLYGRVIGIVVRKMVSNASSYEGLGFAIPIDGAKVILDAIIKDGAFHGQNPVAEGRSLLGVTGYGVRAGLWYRLDPVTGALTSADTAQEGYHQAPVNGVYVSEVTGTNVQGRLYAGDIITAVDGLEMTTIQDVIGAVNRHYAGETVTLSVYRGGSTVTVQAMLLEGAVS